LLTPEGRERLSQLTKTLRGNEPLRSFVKKVGVSHAVWGAWEAKQSGLGGESQKKLANFLGVSVERLQLYLSGGCTLGDLLSPAGITTVAEGDLEQNLDAVFEQVLVWLNRLSLSQLLQIANRAISLANSMVSAPNKENESPQHDR
jgi:hypothetical protein